MGKKTTCVNPYDFPGLKLTQRERENFKNNQRSLRYRISKDEILEIIAESLREVISCFKCFAFHIPVAVSEIINANKSPSIPEIGKKKEKQIVISFNAEFLIV